MKRRIFGLTVATAILVLIVAACGGDDPTSTPVPTATTAPVQATTPPGQATSTPRAATATPRPTATPTRVPATPTPAGVQPKYGGVVHLGSVTTNAASGNYAPSGIQDNRAVSQASTVTHNIYNNLLIFDPYQGHKVLQGDLINQWEVSDDGLTTILRLVEGVQWHDGMPFIAADVVSSIEQNMSPPEGYRGTYQGLLAPRVASITAVDDLTVEIVLRAPSAFFISLLTSYTLHIWPAHIPRSDLKDNPVGTGPFKLESFKRDIETVLVRNDNYFRKDPDGRALPFLDMLVWNQFSGVGFWLAALRTGQVKMVDTFHGPQLTPTVQRELSDAVSGIRFDFYIQTQYGPIFKNVPPFDDARVRKAISLWLDRKEILDIDTEGSGSHYGAGMIPVELGGFFGLPPEEIMATPGYRYLDKDGNLVNTIEAYKAKRDELVKDPADREAAKALLAEAGIEPGTIEIELLVQGGGVQDRIGVVAAAQLSDLFGTTWEIRISSNAGSYYTEHIFPAALGGKDDWVMGWGNIGAGGLDDPNPTMDQGGLLGTSFWHLGGFPPDEEFDALYREQDLELDVLKRRELIYDLQRLIINSNTVRIVNHLPLSPGAHYPEIMDRPGAGEISTNQSNMWRYERMWLDE